MPALRMDAALVHLNRADRRGNGQYLGPDPYFDDLFCEAADAAYVSCERLVGHGRAGQGRPPRRPCWSAGTRSTGVVETPNGAHFTSCAPDYGRDEAFQKLYATHALAASSPSGSWPGDEHAYQSRRRRPGTRSSSERHDRHPRRVLRRSPAPRPGAATARCWPARWA